MMAPATCWASWADALYIIDQRPPVVTATVVYKLTVEEDLGGCFQELRNVTTQLDSRPQWHDLKTGTRPGVIFDEEPGEYNVLAEGVLGRRRSVVSHPRPTSALIRGQTLQRR